jgi:hypothetical protein
MLEMEYQFFVKSEHARAKIEFRTGVWTIQIDQEDCIQVDDRPGVLYQKTVPTLAEEYVNARIVIHNNVHRDPDNHRTTPAKAIYDYLKLRLQLDSSQETTISVSKSGRIKE